MKRSAIEGEMNRNHLCTHYSSAPQSLSPRNGQRPILFGCTKGCELLSWRYCKTVDSSADGTKGMSSPHVGLASKFRERCVLECLERQKMFSELFRNALSSKHLSGVQTPSPPAPMIVHTLDVRRGVFIIM
ncbi:hypothetical protein TNCV_3083371 [Trichonephila clavipes]|nr:hypothetical protein TNCV_3083371 [Trichonephila clavipes]